MVDSATNNEHFATADTWHAAQAMLTFRPLQPRHTAGLGLQSLRVHIRDHKKRDVALGDRTLEAHYGAFVLSQARRGENEARRLALDVSYGSQPYEARIGSHEARVYELGPEVEPDDIDGRSPSVVTWSDGHMFYLVASAELPADTLIQIAGSLYFVRPAVSS